MKVFAALSALVLGLVIIGCDVHMTVVQSPPAVVEVEQPEPDVAVIQEGAMYQGAVVVEPPVVEEVVFVGGRYHYWHPGYHRWVAYHEGWRPREGLRVRHLNSWREHPMYAHAHPVPGHSEAGPRGDRQHDASRGPKGPEPKKEKKKEKKKKNDDK